MLVWSGAQILHLPHSRPGAELTRRRFNAVKCNLKELTTKSAWVPRSAVFSTHMLGGWLHRSCDSLARSVFPSCWVLSAIFFVLALLIQPALAGHPKHMENYFCIYWKLLGASTKSSTKALLAGSAEVLEGISGAQDI